MIKKMHGLVHKDILLPIEGHWLIVEKMFKESIGLSVNSSLDNIYFKRVPLFTLL